MASKVIVLGACALLTSAALADGFRSGDAVKPLAAAKAPGGNWAFGTCTGDDFVDNFDSYTPGNLCNQSGWEEWVGSTDVCGTVTTEQAFSPPHSLKIVGTPPGMSGLGDDTVHLVNINGGVWTFSVQTYVPTGATGDGWIILQNTYPGNPPGTGINWSLQVHLKGTDGIVLVDFTNEQVPLIRDRWVEFRAEIDLPNDSVDYFYNGQQFVFGKSWVDGVSGGGRSAIASIDLYGGDVGAPGGPTTGVYYDDVMLVGNPGCGGGCDPCDTNCDGTVDAFDIEPFIDVLVNPNPNPCSPCSGDADGSGTVDAFDIEPFINCLVGP